MLDKIKEIACQYVEIDPEEITEKTGLKAELGLTSLALMNLLVDVEDAFGIEIDEAAALEFETVQDLLDYLSSNGSK